MSKLVYCCIFMLTRIRLVHTKTPKCLLHGAHDRNINMQTSCNDSYTHFVVSFCNLYQLLILFYSFTALLKLLAHINIFSYTRLLG
jgi:hypothetical protein